jgi:hypothetical protein
MSGRVQKGDVTSFYTGAYARCTISIQNMKPAIVYRYRGSLRIHGSPARMTSSGWLAVGQAAGRR